jgi:hypothetical protein
MPRAGSTMIQQILRLIFSIGVDFIFYDDFVNTDRPILGTYRDFRDVAFSYWRILRAKYDDKGNIVNIPTERDVYDMIDSAKRRIEVLDKYHNTYKSNICWMTYEKFYNDYNYIFDNIKTFLGVSLTEDEKVNIIEKTNIKTNKAISEKVPIIEDLEFSNWDRDSLIHARHIFTGVPGEWKNIVPSQYHHVIEEKLNESLVKYNYIKS